MTREEKGAAEIRAVIDALYAHCQAIGLAQRALVDELGKLAERLWDVAEALEDEA